MQISEQSDAQKLYDFVRNTDLEPGRLFSKSELSAALGKPIEGQRSALYRANRMLQEAHNRELICETRKGYRIAYARESPEIAKARIKRARSQVRRGVRTLKYTDQALLDQDERQENDLYLSGLQALEKRLGQAMRRIDRVEGRVEMLEEAPRLTREEYAFLQGLMKQRSE